MDLQEWVKSWNVWKLESEAFKQPIEIKIWYDNTDIKKFDSKIADVRKELENYTQNKDLDSFKDEVLSITKSLSKKMDGIDESVKDVEELEWKHCKAIKQLSTSLDNQSDALEKRVGTISQLEKRIEELEKKITKQPRVFRDKIFISWHEEVMLGVFDIPDWDYLLISTIEIGEHNEYCENKDWVMIDKIHIQDWFTPRYQLFWGTELDTPTATVYYTLLLMPL